MRASTSASHALGSTPFSLAAVVRERASPRARRVEDVLLAVVDGLKGFPEAILAVFPEATVQTCIVHLLRHSLDSVSWKDRKP